MSVSAPDRGDSEHVEYVCPLCDQTVAPDAETCPNCGQAFELGLDREERRARRLWRVSPLKALAVLLLAIGPLLALVSEFMRDGPPYAFLGVSLVFAAAAAIAWKWPRGGGVLLLIAGAVMSLMAIVAVDLGHAWEEGASWTLSDILLVIFLGGVPFAAGTLFLVAGSRARRSPHHRPAGQDIKRSRSALVALVVWVACVGLAWATPLGQSLPELGLGSPAADRFPAYSVWSPDGRWIAYSDCESGGNCVLAIIGRDGSASRTLTERSLDARTPTWSPDGRRIAFVADDDIWAVGTEGRNLRNLTRTPDRREYSPEWSPAGGLIAFVREVEYDFLDLGDVFVMKPDGSEQRNLTRSESHDENPVWSPDGRAIAFEGSSETGESGCRDPRGCIDEILVVAREGGAVTDLTHQFFADDDPAWSPDSRLIAFHSVRAGFNDLFVMNADGSRPHNVTDVRFEARVWEPAWSPDGKAIAFAGGVESVASDDIWVVGTGGHARPRNLTRTPMVEESSPQWSPDGRTILYESSNWATDGEGLFVMNADGTGKRNLLGVSSD